MKKSLALTMISILALLAIVFCALYFSSNAKSGRAIEELNAAVGEKTEQVEALTSEIEEKAAETEKLTEEAAEHAAAIVELREGADAMNTEIEGLTADVEAKAGEIDSLKADVAAKGDEISGLKADVAAKDDEISGLKADVAARDDEISGLKADVASKSREIEELEANAEALSGTIEELNATVTDKTAEIERLTAEATESSEEIAALKTEAESRQEEITILTARVEEYENQAGQQDTVPADVEGKYDVTRFLRKALNENGVKYSYYVDNNGNDCISSSWTLNYLTAVVKIFIPDDNHIDFRVWNLIDFTDDNILNVMVRCNALNSEYRYAKFFLDNSDNSVSVYADLVLSEPSDAQVAGYSTFSSLIDILIEAEDILAPYAA
ncbi:MAG: YbjN domain-containing protein [Oscillospiraceae bacterium]|nr:YbjN domain-containing protein [Oscillospiraceae bacterium]